MSIADRGRTREHAVAVTRHGPVALRVASLCPGLSRKPRRAARALGATPSLAARRSAKPPARGRGRALAGRAPDHARGGRVDRRGVERAARDQPRRFPLPHPGMAHHLVEALRLGRARGARGALRPRSPRARAAARRAARARARRSTRGRTSSWAPATSARTTSTWWCGRRAAVRRSTCWPPRWRRSAACSTSRSSRSGRRRRSRSPSCSSVAAGRSIRRTIARCPYIAFEGRDFESYLETLGASHRANFRRRLRQIGREFEVEWRPVRDEDERRAGDRDPVSAPPRPLRRSRRLRRAPHRGAARLPSRAVGDRAAPRLAAALRPVARPAAGGGALRLPLRQELPLLPGGVRSRLRPPQRRSGRHGARHPRRDRGGRAGVRPAPRRRDLQVAVGAVGARARASRGVPADRGRARPPPAAPRRATPRAARRPLAGRGLRRASTGERMMLRAAIKAAGAWALYSTGCDRVIGAARRVEQEPLVLCYHRVVHDLRRHTWSAPAMLVTQRTLAAQLDWVGRRYEFVELDELAAASESGAPAAVARSPPSPSTTATPTSTATGCPCSTRHGHSRHRLRGHRPDRHRRAPAPRPVARAAAAGQPPLRRDRDRLAARSSSPRASALAARRQLDAGTDDAPGRDAARHPAARGARAPRLPTSSATWRCRPRWPTASTRSTGPCCASCRRPAS